MDEDLEMLEAEDVLGAESAASSRARYEALKKLPVDELQKRAGAALADLYVKQQTILTDDNARAYQDTYDQTKFQFDNSLYRCLSFHFFANF